MYLSFYYPIQHVSFQQKILKGKEKQSEHTKASELESGITHTLELLDKDLKITMSMAIPP